MNKNRYYQRGFTLVELMIVVFIIGILGAVAYPSYQDSVRKSHRNEGLSMVMEIAGKLERYYYNEGSFSVDLTDLGYGSAGNVATENGYYKVSVATATVACPIATCYLLRATPQGGQAVDGILELTSTGIKRRDKNSDNDTADSGEDSWD